MGRLIDADVLKIRLYHNKETVINDALVKCIDETPTAFDVEAVEKQIKELADHNGNAYLDSADVLEIVRKGGLIEKKLYRINLEGCDDETIFEMELTESEYQFLLKVAEKANETSTYGCMPRMYVNPYKEEGGENE